MLLFLYVETWRARSKKIRPVTQSGKFDVITRLNCTIHRTEPNERIVVKRHPAPTDVKPKIYDDGQITHRK